MTKISILLLALVSCHMSFGQNYSEFQKDSLHTIWENDQAADSIKYQAMRKLIKGGYMYVQPDSAYLLSRWHLNRAQSQNNSVEQGHAIQNIGLSYAIRGQIDSALIYFSEAYDTHKKTDYLDGMEISSYSIGNVYNMTGDREKALEYYEISREINEKTNNVKGVTRILYAEASIFQSLGNYDKCLEKINECIAIEREIDDKKNLCGSLTLAGNCYRKKGHFIEAINTYYEAIQIAEESGSKREEAGLYVALSNLNHVIANHTAAIENADKAGEIYRDIQAMGEEAGVYVTKSIIYRSIDSLDQSIAFATKAVEIYSSVPHGDSKQQAYISLAETHFEKENYLKTIEFAQACLNDIKDVDRSAYVDGAYLALGRAHYRLNDDQQAEYYAQLALEHSQKNSAHSNIRDAAHLLYYLNQKKGDYKKAFEMNELYVEYDRSLRHEEEKEELISKQVQYEFDKKALTDSLTYASEKTLLEERNYSQRRISTAAIIGLLIMIILAFILFRSYKTIKVQKATISDALTEKETLLKEIHHRVKNNLQVVSSLLNLQTKSTNDEAAKSALKDGQTRVHSMSLIHQNLYTKGNLTGIKVKDYLANLTQNLFNTYNINPEKISLKMEIDDLNFDVDTVVPLGLIVNELITNSLKYGFPDDRNGEINITLGQVGDHLELKVEDNGVGIENVEEATNGESFGYGLINAFIKKLKATIHVDGENGTCVVVGLRERRKE